MAGDDVKEVKNYDKLDRYEKFEKLFPFWRMDANAFAMYVKQAVHIDVKNNRHPDHKERNLVDSEILGIKVVSIQALAEAFQRHTSWNDLSDSNSNFVQYLRDVCTIPEEDKPQHSFDVEFIDIHKLKVLGLLLCEGSTKEKAFELYDIC